MTALSALVKRSIKIYFKDKGMFFTSLITPLVLLVLYVTFLKNVYEDSFTQLFSESGIQLSDEIINGVVGGQLVASLLAVSCITVAFCSNMLMVQDKYTGAAKDISVSPVSRRTTALGYYIGAFVSTLLVCVIAAAVCLVYLKAIGWFMDISDIFKVLLDIILLTMFGTALSSIVNCFLSTQGQVSAVGTIVSAGYGFICGAYMPISQFSDGLAKVLAFLPSTYGTSLLKNHFMCGVFSKMNDIGIPDEAIEAVKDAVDCNIYFLDKKTEMSIMYIWLVGAVIISTAVYIGINIFKKH